MDNHRELLCLNILGYKKPGISDEDYRQYMINVHGPLVGSLMEKYGFVSWNMTHNTAKTRGLMQNIFDPQFANIAQYDSCIQIVFPDIECFVRMKADPFFREKVGPDHENFADTKASQMTIGWFAEILSEGKMAEAKPKPGLVPDAGQNVEKTPSEIYCGEL
ncbi:uncharacterized protein BDR25DRAFT_391485 [Lindgomyces ingoldianus]|uniref:Uncharacterized protein n=1 Tax=Lindgomyces ingoldianus TaxID=673940 RepID=A0ACB6R9X8_9PLEO|nr:uncharacterized protein BDR25DRAFT_391485 [Lindgomyces ingoldianus]KAF2475266.1 hypothetical protein BDR25DRAFT_391485 [Lindgomyces ingoldianus]